MHLIKKLIKYADSIVWPEFFNNTLVLSLIWLLMMALTTDLSAHKIPNSIIVFGLVASLVTQMLTVQGLGVWQWLAGSAVGLLCFLPLYLLRGMAAGDVKLMAAVGGFLGYPLILNAVIYSLMVGAVLALVLVVIKKRYVVFLSNMRVLLTDAMIKGSSGVNVADDYVMQHSTARMPFALAIALGTIVTLYLEK